MLRLVHSLLCCRLLICTFTQMGRIANRGVDFISAKEWMCTCFELVRFF
jgi:hypothetical protein